MATANLKVKNNDRPKNVAKFLNTEAIGKFQ